MNTSATNSAMETLGRKPRVSRCQRARTNSVTTKPLQIIIEESEPTRPISPMPEELSSTSASSVSSAKKARRRQFNLSASDIQIARDFVGLGDDQDDSREDRLLLVPPASARLAPVPSPDSFQLEFTDETYAFPHPPIPTPTSLKSRHEQSSFLMSDSEDELPSPKFNPRRGASIQPLSIRKHMSLSIGTELLGPCKLMGTHPSPFTSDSSSCASSYGDDETSDSDSDYEWYNNELSKIVTVTPPPCQKSQKPRPDSVFVPSQNKRMSRPSGLLDPAFPSRKAKRESRVYIPSYPPPPVPTLSPKHLKHVSHLVPSDPFSPVSSRFSFTVSSPERPPPRSSVPADFDLEDDGSSVFSYGVYMDDGLRSAFSVSPLDDAEFDIDMDMMLPSSVPCTPVNMDDDVFPASPLPTVLEESTTDSISDFSFSPSVKSEKPLRDSWASFYVSEPPTSPSPSPAPQPKRQYYSDYPPSPSPPPAKAPKYTIEDEERILKSKWSSSTLGSIREEHAQSGHRISSKLRLFSPKKSSHQRSGSKSVVVPPTPMSPVSFMGSPSKHRGGKAQRGHKRESSNHMLAFMGGATGVRRRGSCSTVSSGSDAGSEVSASSEGSNGLRRKPIPLELLLRV